jgi:hypothetical protein
LSLREIAWQSRRKISAPPVLTEGAEIQAFNLHSLLGVRLAGYAYAFDWIRTLLPFALEDFMK